MIEELVDKEKKKGRLNNVDGGYIFYFVVYSVPKDQTAGRII